MTSRRTARRGPVTVTLAAHRESHGLSQPDVAKRIHELGWPTVVDPSTISGWETGSRRMPDAVVPLYAAAVRVGHGDIVLPAADDLVDAKAS